MRLTKERKETILNAFKADLTPPRDANGATIETLVRNLVVKNLPIKVQEMYKDEDLRKYLNTSTFWFFPFENDGTYPRHIDRL